MAHLPGYATDLSKIDRTIGKEPEYHSKPKYCLLVFGPEGKTRVWLVLDGDVLYADCKGDGDLTGTDRRFSRKGTSFFVGTLPASHDGLPLSLRLDVSPRSEGEETRCRIQCYTGDSPGFRTSGVVRFTDRPQDAPVVNVAGRRTLTLGDWGNPGKPPPLVRGEKDNELSILVGTPVFGAKQSAFATFLEPKRRVEGYPVVVVEFPAGNPGAKPILVRAAVRL
jgi:hypothetical protein